MRWTVKHGTKYRAAQLEQNHECKPLFLLPSFHSRICKTPGKEAHCKIPTGHRIWDLWISATKNEWKTMDDSYRVIWQKRAQYARAFENSEQMKTHSLLDRNNFPKLWDRFFRTHLHWSIASRQICDGKNLEHSKISKIQLTETMHIRAN